MRKLTPEEMTECGMDPAMFRCNEDCDSVAPDYGELLAKCCAQFEEWAGNLVSDGGGVEFQAVEVTSSGSGDAWKVSKGFRRKGAVRLRRHERGVVTLRYGVDVLPPLIHPVG